MSRLNLLICVFKLITFGLNPTGAPWLLAITCLFCWQVGVQQFYKRRPIISFGTDIRPAATSIGDDDDVDRRSYSNRAASVSESVQHLPLPHTT